MTPLIPFALKDAPALIETVFPAQKVSFEAQKERKANLGQTLTGLGSYWKGRKPLILVRAILLGSILPKTDDVEKDLEIFEALMAFDIQGLGRRAVAQAALKPNEIAKMISLPNPWDFFSFTIMKGSSLKECEVEHWSLPFNANELGIGLSWLRGLSDDTKAEVYSKALASLQTYQERALLCKRPEEIDQNFLLDLVWVKVNAHLGHLGINAQSISELVEQLGILRYGRRTKVGDTFAGGGSIPFEAARMGCDVYASDLNPVACMLNWANLNVIGASPESRDIVEIRQKAVSQCVDREITLLGIEHDKYGNRAKAFLYCMEVRCPETGWMVPLSATWVLSKTRNTIATMLPDHTSKRFLIKINSNASTAELKEAARGTVRDGSMVYTLDGETYSTSIKTLRGDYRKNLGEIGNRLRQWELSDFKPRADDIFQERLYAIQWIVKDTLDKPRQKNFFAEVTAEDNQREQRVDTLVAKHLSEWQAQGRIPDMEIEPGDNTTQPIRERGWTHWHHLFNARQLLIHGLFQLYSTSPSTYVLAARGLDYASRLCRWDAGHAGSSPQAMGTFTNQALNTLFNYGCKSAFHLCSLTRVPKPHFPVSVMSDIELREAKSISTSSDLWITDPPYADAVNYHEITEFFIAWLRKKPPKPFDEWTWDSRRALAIKGAGDDFRKGMVDAYSAMANHMPDNGMQCVMFTHQDTGVWSDMVGIFWAAGLQVVGAWYIATETSTELKKGGYVQGTVILMLRKRPSGENAGFKQRLLPAVRAEVKHQIETMMHLNDEVKDKMGEPVFNDSDLQMAGYAAALKVLTAYTHIGGEDVTTFALKPRTKGEVTVVDEIVQQAAEAANNLLVPEGLSADTWQKLSGIQRFYLRMMDIETTGAAKLDNYQNFAKAFRVEEYTRVMGSMTANKAQLKRITEFASRDLTESNEIGSTWLGHLIIGLQQLLAETDPQAVISQLQADLPDFMEIRTLLMDVLTFIENKAPEQATRDVAEVLGARLRNMRALGN
jgi:putative DNA methylase